MILGSSVSETYIGMLQKTLSQPSFVQTAMVQPISRDFHDIARMAFEEFEFPDGRFGTWWIEDRLKALFDEKGEYWKPLRREGQFDYVLSALKGMTEGTMPRWNANRLVLTLFKPSDLHKSRCPIPPCLINLSFYPVRQKLTLIANFRAQYTDAKGYGNLLSLAMLFLDVCDKTGFTPNRLYSIAQKPILKYSRSTGKKLLIALQKL